MSFAPVFWYWIGGIFIGFLPLELFSARSQKDFCRNGTFSEFVWWSFGVKPRVVKVHMEYLGSKPGDFYLTIRTVPFAIARRFILAGLCVSLTLHFVFALSFIPVAVFGALAGLVMLRAVIWERA